MFKIAYWYNNFQASSVLMIDDLSDAYIDVYKETYKNDWGYLCNEKGSSFEFLKYKLLNNFPLIKITFFTPYLRHAVINENSHFLYKKFAIGERIKFINFLQFLVSEGHEIAHHGSNHGKYIDNNKLTTIRNWIHEWALFDDIDTGVKVTLDGVDKFKNECGINVVGGKYCGYILKDNSQEIIDKCNFLYWCDKPSYTIRDYSENFFGNNKIISFPTNFPGNAFVRLTYLSGDLQKDKKKKKYKYFQPLYNLYNYIKLYKLYKNQHIISIQEHNSPSTTAGIVQSANIVSDIKSLNKIYRFLSQLSIWYATCEEIAKYIYIRENSSLFINNEELIIDFENKKNIQNCIISLISKNKFILKNYKGEVFLSTFNNKSHVLNLNISTGKNHYFIVESIE